MTSSPFLIALQQHLPEDAFPWVVAALLRDPLIWKALQGELGDFALARLEGNPTAWHPAALARLALEHTPPPPDNASPPLPPTNLAEAARLVEKIHQFRQEHKQWEGILDFLQPDPRAWQTPLACVLAERDDGAALLHALGSQREGVVVGLNALLSQPLPPESLAARVAEFLHHVPLEQRFSAIGTLAERRADLLSAVVSHLPTESLPAPYHAWQTSVQAFVQGHLEKATQTLTQAWEEVRLLWGKLAIQQAYLAQQQGDLPTALTAWEQAAQALPERPELTARRILALHRARHTEKALELLPAKPQHPALLTVAAHIHQSDYPKRAHDLACRAFAHEQPLPDDLLRLLVETLLALECPTEAATTALRLAHRRPADVEALDLAADATLAARHPQAMTFAFLAYRHAPTPERLRRLAAAEEQSGLLPRALHHRRRLAKAAEATPDDHLALARLALRMEADEEAIQTVQSVLAHQPDHPGALTVLGEALLKQGRLREAQRHLQTAIAQQPKEAAPYLVFADLLERTRGPQAAVDLLQNAIHALPHDAEVHYRLGQRLLHLERPAQARPMLEKAHRFAPRRPDVACALAEALLALGEAQIAADLLRPIHEESPSPASTRLLARAFMALEQPQQAASLLAAWQQRPDATPEDLLSYARALLAAKADPDHAAHVLEDALAQLPHADAPALLHADLLQTLAEAHRARQREEEALAAYRQALRLLPERHPHRQRAIVQGLAETALHTQRAEVALAAIEDVLQKQPHDAHLRRLQAEAYQALGFRDQAIDAGAEALRLSHHSTETILWYSRLLADLGEPAQAATVLETAAATQPPRPEIVLLLARIYRDLAQPTKALAALESLLDKNEDISPPWCARIGQEFATLEQPQRAAACLRRATHLPSAPLAWHLALVQALQAQDAFEEAIEAAQQALQRPATEDKEENNARLALHLAIVHNHLAQGHTHEATLALHHALEIHPHASSLLRAAVPLWRVLGNLEGALQSAQTYLQHHPEDAAMRLCAAYLAQALLRSDEALRILENMPQDAPATAVFRHLYAALAANALARGEEIAAAEALAAAQRYRGEEDAWILALQARLSARQVDHEVGHQQLEAAVAAAPEIADHLTPAPEIIASWEAIADTAAELHAWEIATTFAERAASVCPHNPATALRLAQLAVLRTEAEHRCEALEAKIVKDPQHPSTTALHKSWRDGLAQAARYLNVSPDDGYQAHPTLHRWFARGQAAFEGQILPVLLDSPVIPTDVTAALDALRRREMPLPRPLTRFQEHPLVQLHHALLLENLPSGDIEEALRFAQAARQARPHWAAAHFLVARLAHQLGDLNLASEAIAAALRLSPNEPRWHALAASICAEMDDRQGTFEHLQKAIELEPQHLPHHLALAEAYLEHDNPEAARRALEEALVHHDEAPALHLLLARTLFRMGKLNKAARHADKAARDNRSAAGPVMLRIQIALAQNDPQTALQQATRWLQDHPHHPEAIRHAVHAYLALEDPQSALRLVEEALEHRPDKLELHILRAELHTRLHGGKAASATWRNLLASYPDAPALWLGLAEALAAARELTDARTAAHKALRQAEALSRDEQVRLHLLLGNLAKEEGQLDQALYHFGEAVRRAPTHREALLKLAQVQNDRDDYLGALETLKVLQYLAPEDSRAFYLAGLIYKTLRDYEAAEAMFRKAAQLDPTDFRIRRQLAAVAVVNLLPS